MNQYFFKDILLIEDDPGITELISAELIDSGYQMHCAYTAHAGFDYLMELNPDLIILDYGLPDYNGLEFIEELSRRGVEMPPFVVSTGIDDARIAVSMMKHGAKDFLIKDASLIESLPGRIKRIEKELEQEYLLEKARLDIQKKNEELCRNFEHIQSINSELELARKKAEESDRLKTAFLANLSHEIRTPMNGIMGFAQLLKNSTLTTEDQREYLEVIEQSGQRMLKLITDLVDISKIEAGQVEVVNSEFHINKLMEELYAFFKPDAATKNLSLHCEKFFSDQGKLLISDRTKIYQVFTNLISNALKFTSSGEVRFGYRDQENNTLLCWVSDSGIGIEKEQQEAIFIRFMQAESDTSRAKEGSGLGLSISKAFVNSLGGEIWVESEPNVGSTFYFTVPYQSARTEKVEDTSSSSVLHSNRELVFLVAEDEDMNFLFIRESFKDNRIELIRVVDGIAAVQAVKENPAISLILMDVKMPLLNGIEAGKQIHQIRPELPIIGQSAYASPADISMAIESGFADYVVKPINKDELFSKINKILV